METLLTPRLAIRALEASDLETVGGLLARAWNEVTPDDVLRDWLTWTALGEDQLARLHQPPYGDRGVIWRASGELCGLVGFVPLLGPFAQLPGLGGAPEGGAWMPEVGLYWTVDPAWQGRGSASEAGAALIQYAFKELHLRRILATTTHTNLASQAVMRKIGMQVERNPHPTPEWMEVVGFRESSAPKGQKLPESKA